MASLGFADFGHGVRLCREQKEADVGRQVRHEELQKASTSKLLPKREIKEPVNHAC